MPHTHDVILIDKIDLKSTEKLNASSLSLPDATSQPSSNSDLSYQINQYIAAEVLPNIRRYLVDSDKVAASCANIAYYIIAPALRSRSRYALHYMMLINTVVNGMRIGRSTWMTWH
jgi:cellulase/cellobiase CelA1